MIYYTGDIHGQKYQIECFCKRFKPTKDDTIVILGDVAANYSRDERDTELKQALNKLKPTILCIHGNHEIRPWNIPTYKTKIWNGGTVWYEEEYPSVLFAKDGEIYDLEGIRHIAIGGACRISEWHWMPKRDIQCGLYVLEFRACDFGRDYRTRKNDPSQLR